MDRHAWRRPFFVAKVFALPLLLIFGAAGAYALSSSHYKLVGWNDLGMHCMDSEYSIFSILPPYNTIHAQLIDPNGKLVKNATVAKVTYQAVADPTGSINKSSLGKTTFWQYVKAIFGAAPAANMGLAGQAMPGSNNTPQPMVYDTSTYQWGAVGIPITPYDDAKRFNAYPMMRLTAKSSSGTVLATTDIVLPVSDEMSCATCHASKTPNSLAKPVAGWVNNADKTKDYKLNILRLHDERQAANAVYRSALAAAGRTGGLYSNALAGKPTLCASCHGSNALSLPGRPGVPSLTASMHSYHAHAADPVTGQTLDASTNRSACYRCHPGSTTKCLRGAMGTAVDASGNMSMQCQSCHGQMHTVGVATRKGWLNEPACQSCHTGTATSNNGQIRYTSVFDTTGNMRQAVNSTFATNPNKPAAGLSLYRFSTGHGGLFCESCHGSTHAEWPSTAVNDNIQCQQLQGHSGTMVECQACHGGGNSVSANGGPHGMHTVGQAWVSAHHDYAEHNRAACQACHGADYKGTVLSAAKADRTFKIEDRSITILKGTRISCYTCHNGPGGEGGGTGSSSTSGSTSGSTHTHATTPTREDF